MGWLMKTLGGAAIAVGAVVASPVAGAFGAITLVGAVTAGAVGATAGTIAHAIDDSEETAYNTGYSNGREDGLAEQAEKVQILQSKIETAATRYKTVKKQEEFIVGMLAVGFALANADGVIDQNEVDDIDEFVTGVSKLEFSSNFLSTLDKLKKTPPDFTEAMKYVEAYIPKKHYNLVDELLMVAAESDGIVCESEKAFMQSWKEYRSAN